MNELELRETSDAALMVSVGRYSEEALAEAYRRHGGNVYALARRLLRNDALAQEVTQEIFLRLWDKPERFDATRGSLRSFLLSDTHGRSIDLVRAEGARRDREAREAKLVPKPSYDLEQEVWALVTSERVREALGKLSDGERQAIELAYFGGQTYQQVAVTLGQPEGTVKSRIRSGLKRLRRELAYSGVMST